MRSHAGKIKHELNNLKNKSPDGSALSRSFELEEIEQPLKNIKTNKAPCFDEILINTGPRPGRWLADFFTYILNTGSLTKEYKYQKSYPSLNQVKLKT